MSYSIVVLRVFLNYTNQPKPLLHRNVKWFLLVIINDCFFRRKGIALVRSKQNHIWAFVFSSDVIQELTKSLHKVCFRFLSTYILINLELTCFRAAFVWSCTLPPFLLAAYSCDHNAYKNSISSRRAQPISLVTSQHLGHTLETSTLRTTSFNLLSVFKQLKQVLFFSLV